MRFVYYSLLFIIGGLFLSTTSFAQGPDCVDAQVICSSSPIPFTPVGPGINDFAGGGNAPGCLVGLEHQSAWYYFEFNSSMPPGSSIEFTIDPNGGAGEDYDFAIYGPDVDCNTLGSPIRCSFAASSCGFCPATGLGMGAGDFSEGAGGDGFVAPITVNPGQGYYLLVDNWLGSSNGFNLTWGGSAAPFLNCDANPGCELDVTLGPDENVCSGDPNPIILFPFVTGNTGTETYSWSGTNGGTAFLSNPFSPSPSVNIPPGFTGTIVYTLTVTDGGCMDMATITINVTGGTPPVIGGDPFMCEGGFTVLDAGPGYSSYSWSTLQNTQMINVFTPGLYSVTVTDANGCASSADILVIQLMGPTPILAGDLTICPGGFATINAEFGFSSYSWSNGATTQSITVTAPGIYSVTVTDPFFGCPGSASWQITSIPGPNPSISGDEIFCEGGSTDLSVSPNNATYAYIWSNGESGANITVDESGLYTVTVIDATGCQGTAVIPIAEIPNPTTSISGNTLICGGIPTTLDAGDGFSTYFWSDGSNTQTINPDMAGDYSVTVTNSDGCEAMASVTVTEMSIDPPSISGDLELCPDSDGVLDAGGGYASYLWSDGTTTQSVSINGPGTYSVTVENAEGCQNEATVAVSAHPTPMPTISGAMGICPGTSTTLNAGDGYDSYLWSDGTTDQNFTTDQTGNYSVTVTNSFGCEGVDAVTVSELQEPTVDIQGDAMICPEGDTQLDAGGGFASYMWSDGTGNQNLDVDEAGDYSVTVVASNGCEGTDTFSVGEFESPMPEIIGASSFCGGDSAILDAGVYNSYLWEDGSTDQEFVAFQPGDYSVTVTSADGCIGEATTTLSENALPDFAISGDSIFCEGSSAILDAGEDFESYIWSDGSTEQTLEVDSAGVYTVQVTNSNGCTAENSLTVTLDTLPVPVISGVLNFCTEESTILDAGAGYASYMWSDSTDEQTIEIDSAGLVELTVTDDNGCVGTTSVEVEELELPDFTISGDLEYCENDSTTLEVQGDFAEYLWSDGSDLATLTVDQPGPVSVEITGNNGCVEEASVEIIENALPTVSISGDLEFCEDVSSVLDAGSGFASYEWSDNSDSQTLEVSTSGMYSVVVTDDNGCVNEDEVEVLVNVLPEPTISGDLSYCAEESTVLDGGAGYANYAWSNNTNEQTVEIDAPGLVELTVTDDNGCVGSTSADVEELALPVFAISGDLEYCENENTTLEVQGDFAGYLWSDGSELSTTTIDQPGTVSVEVTGNNGCVDEASVEVIENALPTVSISGELEFCEDVSSVLDAGSGFANYEWSDNSDSQTLEVSTSGMYSVVVTDDNGCVNQDEVEVVVNELPSPEITGLTTFCSDGSTFIGVSESFASYEWSNGAETQEIEVNQAGSYSVIVTDVNGCQQSTSTEVDELAMLEPEILGVPSFCQGESTTLTGEAGFETYEWSNGQMNMDAVVNQSGPISLTVTDLNGCTGTTTIDVAQLALPEPTITGQDYFCTNTNTEIDAGAGYNAYAWSNGGDIQTLTIDQAGTYEVTVTDANSCDGVTNITITEAPLPQPTIDGAVEYCPATSTELSTANIFETYQWSDGTNGTSIIAAQVGSYGLTVTDDLGCVGETSVEVAEFVTNDPVISGDLIFCPGESTAISVGNNFAAYQWSDDSDQPTLTITEAGDYGITVTDQNGCLTSAATTIDEFVVVPPVITGDDAFCTGTTASLDAGTGYQSYDWSNNADTQNTSVGTPGDYFVTVVDNNGCTSSSSFEVEENPLPEVTIGGSTSYCINGFTTLNAGAVYAQYLWSDGTTEQNIVVNQEGNYGLTVTDNNGCIGEAQVVVIEDTELSPVITGIFEYCENGSTIIDAGTGFASYQWSNNAGSQTIEVTQPGNYSVTVMDAAGCVGDTLVAIVENPLPTPSIAGDLEYCDGASTTLDAGSYEDYLWSNGADDQVVTITEPGDYAVIVTDENNCMAETAVFVTENPLPQFNLSGQEFFCAGDFTTISATSGFAAYEWSEGTGEADIVIDQPGDYDVTVTNEFGCIESASISIDEIALPQADPGPAQVLNCNVLSVSLGGNSSQGDHLMYVWTGPGITSSNENQEHPEVDLPGQYEFSIIDTEHNCVSELALVEVEDQTNEPVVLLQVLDEINCTTSEVLVDGSASESGAQIEYQWYDGNGNIIPNANTNIYLASQADMYILRVLDTFTGCSSMDSATVVENIDYPAALAGPDQHLDCIETLANLDGTQSDSGPNIIYSWQTADGNIQTGLQSNQAQVNAPGLYILTVMDTVNSCTNIDSVQVTQDIVPPIANAGDNQELDCITPAVTLNGSSSSTGTNYAYEWTLEGSNSFDFTTLLVDVSVPGDYLLTVTNLINGCTAQDEVVVTENTDVPTDLNALIDDPTCFGDSDGSIVIQDVVGGTAPYMFSLNGEPFTSAPTFGGLEAGEYEMVVQDIIGCEHAATLTVQPGNDLNLDLGEDIFINLGEYAQLQALMSIPSSEVQDFSWKTQYDLSCLNCTEIEVRPFETIGLTGVLEDQNGCVTTDDITVFVNKPYEVYIPNVFSPNNDGHNDVFMIFAGEDVAEIKSFITFNRWGESVFELYSFQPNDPSYGWDGKFRGKLYNGAVFVYLAEVEFIDGEVKLFKGDVAIMR